jgi:hypothetical protein
MIDGKGGMHLSRVNGGAIVIAALQGVELRCINRAEQQWTTIVCAVACCTARQ